MTRINTEQQLAPVWNLVAEVKDDTYQCGRVQVTGTKHFKPGEIIYPHARHSGDGYARTYLTGRARDTNKYITLIGDTHRLEHWRIEIIGDPIVIYELNSFLGWQRVWGENQLEARGIVAARNQVS